MLIRLLPILYPNFRTYAIPIKHGAWITCTTDLRRSVISLMLMVPFSVLLGKLRTLTLQSISRYKLEIDWLLIEIPTPYWYAHKLKPEARMSLCANIFSCQQGLGEWLNFGQKPWQNLTTNYEVTLDLWIYFQFFYTTDGSILWPEQAQRDIPQCLSDMG